MQLNGNGVSQHRLEKACTAVGGFISCVGDSPFRRDVATAI